MQSKLANVLQVTPAFLSGLLTFQSASCLNGPFSFLSQLEMPWQWNPVSFQPQPTPWISLPDMPARWRAATGEWHPGSEKLDLLAGERGEVARLLMLLGVSQGCGCVPRFFGVTESSVLDLLSLPGSAWALSPHSSISSALMMREGPCIVPDSFSLLLLGSSPSIIVPFFGKQPFRHQNRVTLLFLGFAHITPLQPCFC